jgi:uncharacterized protein YjiS (DUF1127 family)
MDAIYNLAELTQTLVPAGLGLTFLKSLLGALLEWPKREVLRADFYDLSDRELMDIGTTRGEIDYVASNRSIDPRGIRSAEWVRYLPTVDGQIVCFQTHAQTPGNRLPVGVNRAILAVSRSLPAFPEERTSSGRPGTSEKCQERKSSSNILE